MQPDAVGQFATLVRGEPTDPVELVRDGVRFLTPGQIGVGVLGSDGSRRRGGTPEEHRRKRVGLAGQMSALDPQMLAREVHRAVGGPQLPDDVEVLAATLVPGLLGQEVAESALFRRFTSGDHVEQ